MSTAIVATSGATELENVAALAFAAVFVVCLAWVAVTYIKRGR